MIIGIRFLFLIATLTKTKPLVMIIGKTIKKCALLIIKKVYTSKKIICKTANRYVHLLFFAIDKAIKINKKGLNKSTL